MSKRSRHEKKADSLKNRSLAFFAKLKPVAIRLSLCHKYAISSRTFYRWRNQFGGLEVKDVPRLKQLEAENLRLKKLAAEQALDIVQKNLSTEVVIFTEKEVEAFADSLVGLLTQARRLQSSKPNDAAYYREAKRINGERLKTCQQPAPHLAVKRWQDFFVEEGEQLYHWVEDRRVPCENSRAERGL
jgi:hypothetical protein